MPTGVHTDELTAFVKEHEAFVRRLAARLAPRPSDGDDIAQQVFLVALNRFNDFDPTRSARAWLAGIVRNMCRKAWERAMREERFRRDKLAVHVESLADDPLDAAEALQHCIAKLPERSRQVLALRYGVGSVADEIAQSLGASAEAVRMALVRIRRELRACIGRTLVQEKP